MKKKPTTRVRSNRGLVVAMALVGAAAVSLTALGPEGQQPERVPQRPEGAPSPRRGPRLALNDAPRGRLPCAHPAPGPSGSVATGLTPSESGDEGAGSCVAFARARELLDRFRRTTDPRELWEIGRTLEEVGGLEERLVRDALLALSQDPEPRRRAAALRLLGRSAAPDAPLVEHLVRAATTEHEAAVRAAAATGLGSMARHPEVARSVNETLSRAALGDRDPVVRYEATVGISVAMADTRTLDALFFLTRADPDPAVRQAAIQALGDADRAHAARTARALERLLQEERDPALRKSLLASVVRVERQGAVPALERIAASAPDLALDARDFIAALGTGATDMDTIWSAKVESEAARLGPPRNLEGTHGHAPTDGSGTTR